MRTSLCKCIALALAGLLGVTACQTSVPETLRASRAELEQQLRESRELVERYEARYGKLSQKRPEHDFRKLRKELKGKPMSAVVSLLGKPAKVFATGSSESWEYSNAAYDPVSGRTVRRLEVCFRNGVVDYLISSF